MIVHGSRSQGLEHEGSDWDLGYLADGAMDTAGSTAALSQVLGTEDIDVTDLARASALLRYRAARDGRCVYEHTPETFEAFILEATLFWCDAEPIIRRAHAALLSDLPDGPKGRASGPPTAGWWRFRSGATTGTMPPRLQPVASSPAHRP